MLYTKEYEIEEVLVWTVEDYSKYFVNLYRFAPDNMEGEKS